jgi:ribosomal protein S16
MTAAKKTQAPQPFKRFARARHTVYDVVICSREVAADGTVVVALGTRNGPSKRVSFAELELL